MKQIPMVILTIPFLLSAGCTGAKAPSRPFDKPHLAVLIVDRGTEKHDFIFGPKRTQEITDLVHGPECGFDPGFLETSEPLAYITINGGLFELHTGGLLVHNCLERPRSWSGAMTRDIGRLLSDDTRPEDLRQYFSE